MTMMNIADKLGEQCCENCENNTDDKRQGVCRICTLNPNYKCHFKENLTIRHLKESILNNKEDE